MGFDERLRLLCYQNQPVAIDKVAYKPLRQGIGIADGEKRDT